MTNLQTVSPKTSPAETSRTEMGNFFQMPTRGSGGNLSNTDFDSFLGSRESKKSEESQPEQQANKNRKKPIDVALATPLAQQEAPLQVLKKNEALANDGQAFDSKSISDLDSELQNKGGSTELNSTEKDKSSYDAIKEQPTSESDETSDSITAENQDADPLSGLEDTVNQSEIKTHTLEENSAIKEAKLDKEIEKLSDSRGMEPASMDSEMIATTSLESEEAPVQPLRDPAITTINRLTAFSSPERAAVAPVTAMEMANDPNLGNAGAGLATPSLAAKLQPNSPTSQAAGVFKSLAPELDKFKQTGRSQIQLDLPVGENESVRIRLSIRGAEIRSTFITESQELREALQKAWPEFSQSSRDRGFRLGDPSFQQGYAENNTDFGQNHRRNTDSETHESGDNVFSPATGRKPLRNPSTAPQPSSTALWA